MNSMIKRKDIFIGREKELRELGKNVFVQTPGAHAFYALTGPNEIGKSYIFKKLRKQWEADKKKQGTQDVFCVPTSIREMIPYDGVDPFWWFWIYQIRRCMEYVPLSYIEELIGEKGCESEAYKKLQKIYEFYGEESNFSQLTEGCAREEDILSLFRYYTHLGIQIIWVIDEFCHMTEFYPEWNMDRSKQENAVQGEESQLLRVDNAKRQNAACRIIDKLLILAPGSIYELNLTLLILGRRTLKSFRFGVTDNSDFAKAFHNRVLRGFSNHELQYYYCMYEDGNIEDNLGRLLTEEEFKSVIYYCGRHPGLLMKMYNMICDCEESVDSISIEKLYQDEGVDIRAVYAKLYELMKHQNVNRSESKSCVGTFMQLFFTPVYEKDAFGAQLESLCDYGFLLNQEDGTVFDMAGMREDPIAQIEVNGKQYEPIAPYFAYYLRSEADRSGSTELYGLMARTELVVRDFVAMVYARKYPDTWKSIIHSLFNPMHFKFYNSLGEKAKRYDAKARGIDYSPLDVLSYVDYAGIIDVDWVRYSRLFCFYTREELLKVFKDVLKTSRDDVMHINQRMMDDRTAKELENACKYILTESGKVAVNLDDIVPAYLSYRNTPEAFVGNGKRYLYQPTLVAENGKKWIEGYLVFTTLNGNARIYDDENRYAVEEVRYYRARITQAQEIEQVDELQEEIAVYVGDWDAVGAFYQVSLNASATNLSAGSSGGSPVANTSSHRAIATPSEGQQRYFNDRQQMMYELFWEDDTRTAVCGYIYHDNGKLKFKAKMSKKIVERFAENGIDFTEAFPESVNVVIRRWDDEMGAFVVGYTAQ